jgi:PIN domain nuclease of toxin-antitoxin system
MPEIIILDTHIWFWFIAREFFRFPEHWRSQIETSAQVGVSPISCYEIALAQQKGRLALSCPVGQWLKEALAPLGIALLPLTDEIACCAVSLSPVHKDPFDRLIIATALIYKAHLASVDTVFPGYSELDGYLMT